LHEERISTSIIISPCMKQRISISMIILLVWTRGYLQV
jgi:hypothetical protein